MTEKLLRILPILRKWHRGTDELAQILLRIFAIRDIGTGKNSELVMKILWAYPSLGLLANGTLENIDFYKQLG